MSIGSNVQQGPALGRGNEGENTARARRHLFGPITDFICLGGGSLFFIAVILILFSDNIGLVDLIFVYLIHALNSPHFANSYQIFYGNFRAKIFTSDYGLVLRLRYVFAGIVVPLILIGFFAYSLLTVNAVLLGMGGNIMAFFVGWHYVKQGYGMAMLDATLKHRFYSAWEKAVLRYNAYACWAFSWLYGNRVLANEELFGLRYYVIPTPDVVFYGVAILGAISTLITFYMLVAKWQVHRREIGTADGLAMNGVVAYLTTLYLWTAFISTHPILILTVPAFHSLQYLIVVWRYQLNIEKARGPAKSSLEVFGRFSVFVLLGLMLGFIGFFGAPLLMDRYLSYNHEIFGTLAFMFIWWIFINVHHYFLDNVMWRKENPDTRKHLFAG